MNRGLTINSDWQQARIIAIAIAATHVAMKVVQGEKAIETTCEEVTSPKLVT
jgi:hypothetical protein